MSAPSIGFYSRSLGWGGSEAYLHALLWGRRQRGERSMLFCPPGYRMLREGMLPPGCSAVTDGDAEGPARPPAPDRAPASGGARGTAVGLVPRPVRLGLGIGREVARLRRLFRRNPVDVLHFNDTGCEPGPVAARLAGVPVIVGTLHALPGADVQDAVRRGLEHVSVRSMDAAIAVSEYTRRAWVERVRVRPERLPVIYNGIDLEAFRPRRGVEEVRREVGLPSGAPVVGVTARLHPMKGHRYLLEAMPRVLAAVPDARLVLAGDGELRPVLERRARALGIAGRVHFLGHRTDVADVTQVYDVAALPSVALECLPYTLMEAMALRKPAVASRFSGIPEVVEDGVTGTLVPPRDPEALAGAVVDLLKQSQKARAFGEAGRRRVEEEFALKRMLDETFALYEELLERGRHGSRRGHR
jgi:glycosyltransferase involved in cell wall biosynthesis